MNLEERVDNYLRMYIQKDIPITREQADEINEYMCELKNEIHDLQIRIEDFLECDKEDYRVYKQGYIRQQQRIDKAIEYCECHFKEMVADEEAEKLLEIFRG